MDRPALMGLVLLLLVVLLGLMLLGWRARRRRQRGVSRPATVPAEIGTELGRFEGKYVATTSTGDPIDRIAVHGLGFRGTALVIVASEGIVLHIAGVDDIWIPAVDLTDRRTATWTIDRVVEEGGLDLITWRLGDRSLDSYFRMISPAAFGSAIDSILVRSAP